MQPPQFSIRWLMLAVAVAAWAIWMFEALSNSRGFDAALAFLAMLGLMALGPWSSARANRRLAFRSLAVAATLEIAGLAYLGVFSLRFYSIVYRMMLSFVLMPIVIGSGVAWAAQATARDAQPRRPWLASWATVLVLIALPASMMFSHWPMRAAYHVSRPALDRLADRIAAGGTLAGPEWAGLFLVKKVARTSVGPGNIALVVDNDSTGHTWLIRAVSPAVEAVVPPSPMLSYRIDCDGRWWHHELD